MAFLSEYSDAIERGERLYTLQGTLEGEIFTYCKMQNSYEIEDDPLRANTASTVSEALAGCGIGTSNLRYVEVRSAGTSRFDDAAYLNYADGRSGVIVCSENYKHRDENPPNERLWASEVLWQSWVKVVNVQRTRPSDLQAIVRFRVVNRSTMQVIWRAAINSTCTREADHHHREYTELDQGYYAILGSINGASSMRILLDHKTEIGYRTVERVIVLGDKQLTLAVPEHRSFILVLSSRRALTHLDSPAGSGDNSALS